MDIQLEIAKSGINTLKMNNFYIHSKYDPIKDATTFATKNYIEGKTHIIYGYGLGYIVQAFKKNRKFNEKIIVIDPFLKIDCVQDAKENVYYIDRKKMNDLTNILNQLITHEDTGKTEVLCSPNYNKIDEHQYKVAFEMISDVLKAKVINYNTIQSLAWTWYDNFIDNLKYILMDQSISVLFNKYTCPVIVVAGGPSLTKQLEHLKEIKGKCLILCAGSTIRTLLKNDIEPDFIVNVDGGEKNLQHFEQVKKTTIKYIYGLQSTAGIRGEFLGDCFYFSPISEPLSEEFCKKYIPNIKKIEGGVSVATYTLTIANLISSGPIALIGQDLAYTNNTSHADGNIQQEKKDYNEDHFYKKVDGYYGDKVMSDVTLISMKNHIENILLKINKTKNRCYNCTEGGAKINNIEHLPFKDFIHQFIQEDVEIVHNYEKKVRKTNKYENFLRDSIEKIAVRKKEIKKCLAMLDNDNFSKDLLEVEIKRCNQLIDKLNLQGVVNLIHLKLNKEFNSFVCKDLDSKITLAIKKNKFIFKELLEMFEHVEEMYHQQLEKLPM